MSNIQRPTASCDAMRAPYSTDRSPEAEPLRLQLLQQQQLSTLQWSELQQCSYLGLFHVGALDLKERFRKFGKFIGHNPPHGILHCLVPPLNSGAGAPLPTEERSMQCLSHSSERRKEKGAYVRATLQV
ncbi:unnamed protein product [Calypogeia fissa]